MYAISEMRRGPATSKIFCIAPCKDIWTISFPTTWHENETKHHENWYLQPSRWNNGLTCATRDCLVSTVPVVFSLSISSLPVGARSEFCGHLRWSRRLTNKLLAMIDVISIVVVEKSSHLLHTYMRTTCIEHIHWHNRIFPATWAYHNGWRVRIIHQYQ